MFSVFLISIFGLRLLAQTRNDIIPLNEFHYTNLFNMTSATEKFQLTPAPTLSGKACKKITDIYHNAKYRVLLVGFY
jgi:hypothetical protein